MKPSMQGKGVAAPDLKPSPSVNMANLTRLSVLIGDADAARSRATAALCRALGVRHILEAPAIEPLLDALKTRAFDLVLCAQQLGGEDGVTVLRSARVVAPATRMVLLRTSQGARAMLPDDLDAIELPLSQHALQGLLERTMSPRGGLWCEVPELSLTDILQMYHQARRSIAVLLSGPIAGRVWMEDGDIVDAEGNGERGMGALSYLLGAEAGLVRTEPPRAPVQRTISAPFQSAILEAAHRLDERRRDTVSSGHPGTDQRKGGFAGGTLPSSAPSPPLPAPASERSQFDRTSVSGDLLRPAMTPPAQAPPSHSPSRHAGRRGPQRQRLLATAGVLLGLVVVGAAASYLGNRVAVSRNRSAAHAGDAVVGVPSVPDIDPASPSRSASPSGAARGSSAPAAGAPARARSGATPAAPNANAPAAPAAAAPAAPFPTAPPPGVPPPPVPPPAVPPPVPAAPAAGSPGAASPRAAAADASFELLITSRPSRATVSEGARVLGKTPLRLTISKSTVTAGPREFIVRLAGHFPVRVVQATSETNVEANVVLSPRPVLADPPDGGLYDPDFDPAEARPGTPRPGRRDLGIRLRR